MAIRYTGTGSLNSVSIGLLGDGQNKAIVIDLTKPPYSVDFQTVYPTAIAATFAIGEIAPSNIVLMSNGRIGIQFDAPLPQVDMIALTPRTRIDIQLIYG